MSEYICLLLVLAMFTSLLSYAYHAYVCFPFRYIRWTDEVYPKGGKVGKLRALLERCVTIFKDEEKYKNDHRYVDAWIKFVSFYYFSGHDSFPIFSSPYSNLDLWKVVVKMVSIWIDISLDLDHFKAQICCILS